MTATLLTSPLTKGERWTGAQSTWKWLGIVAMVLDHVGAVLLPDLEVLRLIGRIAFPIFALLIAVNVGVRMKSPKGYLRPLVVYGTVAIFPAALALPTTVVLNIMFTLLLGALTLAVMKGEVSRWWALTLLFAPVVDYGAFGVAAVVLLTLALQKNNYLALAGGVVALGIANGPLLSIVVIPLTLLLVLLWPLPGTLPRGPKKFFYIFYPAHLFVLGMIGLYLQ